MIATLDSPETPLVASQYDLRVALGEKVPEGEIGEALQTGDWGFVHSFTTGSAVDGPGVRLVGWLTGCQFRCVFCHNPDTWKMKNGMPVSLSRAVEVVNQYRHSLQIMKGGLTISGGEPLLQHRFVLRIFAAAKALGVHTALDSNGSLHERLTDEDLRSIDLVMLGMKAISPELHQRITGQDNAAVLAFARRLAEQRRPMWVRFVLVPGLSDDLDEVGRLADFVGSLGNVQRIDLLPFHQLGRFKWERLGMDYQLRNTLPPNHEKLQQVAARFRSAGLAVV
ncbi:MAG TPA: pyruvate formate-lyase-activating protein [Verrucomicrobiae bacterium]